MEAGHDDGGFGTCACCEPGSLNCVQSGDNAFQVTG